MKTFNSLTTDLLKGINLIEASAGTGKTYAIAILVLRFVVEQNIDIKKILVVTFTKAATEELKERIRSRLLETRHALTNKQSSEDINIKQWLDALTIEPEQIILRLNHALLDIDQAGIFTIHGFCQRVLTEHALECGQLFDTELTGDISKIKLASADDFWRKNIYTRSARETSLLTTHYQTPDLLLTSVDYIGADMTVVPDYEDLEQCFVELKQQIDQHKQTLLNSIQLLQEKFGQGKFKKSVTDNFIQIQQNLIDWLNDESLSIPDFYLFTRHGLFDALNGQKFKPSKANPLSSEEQKNEYIAALKIDTEPFEQIDTVIKKLQLVFRRTLLESLHEDVDKRLQQLNILSFDNLISSLAESLQGNKASSLSKEVQNQYQAILIDEFQDTDKNQWFIFSTLFNTAEHYLYLIGDPKQAIYKFRGADIHSYFAAKEHALHQYSLSYNWRSHPHLVAGINSLFSSKNPFLFAHLEFTPAHAALSSKQGVFVQDNQELPPLVLWQLDKSENEFWSSGKAKDEIKIAITKEILDLLEANFYIFHEDNKPILPKDIAILVRTNKQAKEFQQALNEVGITAVINNKESVFSSAEAFELYILLQALAQPGNNTLLKQALTLSWFNLNGQELFQTINDELAMDKWNLHFQLYHQDWQNKGLMTMMMHLIENEKVYSSLSKNKQAERRITNIQHCIELVQQAVIDEHLGINKTLAWLLNSITASNSGNAPADEQQFRLESDEDAVKIMTMHGSKGLEYPIVFCPFLWQRGDRLSKERSVIKCHTQGEMIADLGTTKFELHRQIALEEELAEDLRVFYVAVTRAKYRCYINWADARTKKISNTSAMAYLLDFSTADFNLQQEKLTAFSTIHPSSFEYRLLETGQQISGTYQPQESASRLHCEQRQRSLFSYWQMSSYTALSSLSLHDDPELPSDKVREEIVIQNEESDYLELPRGAHTGNVIHDLLENIPFSYLSENNDISTQRDKSCLRYGLKTETPEQIDELLKNTVTSSLSQEDQHFCLKNLNEQQCLKEMPFYLSMRKMEVSQINHILKDCATYQSLSEKKMCGYLTGFIDLICEYKGKYYVMDYKSNRLETYQKEALIQAMREHNYGLQYWIYTLVLHQYLKNSLADYNYEQHFGGVKYLFVRGMEQNKLAAGVFQTRPDLKTIEQLAKLILPG